MKTAKKQMRKRLAKLEKKREARVVRRKPLILCKQGCGCLASIGY